MGINVKEYLPIFIFKIKLKMKPKIKLFAFWVLMFACFTGYAQPIKPKTVKPAVVKKVDYQKLKQEIRSLYRDEKHAAVITKAAQYLLKYPKDTAVTFQKAVSHVSLKQNKMGFDLIRKFFVNTDSAAKYISFMAFSIPENDLLTSGIACANEAINMVKDGPYGYFVKGGLYSDKGEHEKALPFMEKTAALCRNDMEKIWLAHFYAKELAFNKQNDKALTTINDLYLKYPGDKDIITSYAVIHRLNKTYDKAIEKYDELIKLFPDEKDYSLQKAGTYLSMGKSPEACNVAETIIEKDSSYEFLRFRYKCAGYFTNPAIADINKATWYVNANGAAYDFTVSKPLGSVDADLEFNWAMTSGDDMNGYIKITREAMDTAKGQNNYFGPGLKNTTLTDKTTVWISKKVFEEITKNGSCKMDVGNGEEVFTLVKDDLENRDMEPFEEKIKVKGVEKFVNTFHIKNEEGNRQLWILNDAKNPLIVKMDIGWSITLWSLE